MTKLNLVQIIVEKISTSKYKSKTMLNHYKTLGMHCSKITTTLDKKNAKLFRIFLKI